MGFEIEYNFSMFEFRVSKTYFMFFTLQVFIVISAILALAVADHRPSYGTPAYKEPEYGPASYKYGYDVKDDYAGVNFGQSESRDGHATSGTYYVLLPDGRTQTVTYGVDRYSGYVADVQYSGYAQEYKPAPAYKPAPSYKPAPAYRPAPQHG